MADYEQEQEMEVEALQAILMDDIKEIDPSESGLSTTARCFEILLSPQDDDFDESANVPVQLALIFAHTEKYPDKPPLLNVKSVRGIKPDDLASLKEKLDQEATENLGMAMVYTLVASAKEWLTVHYGQNGVDEQPEETEAKEEEVIVPHGEAVTVESFLAWRERFEAELVLQRAKLMPDSALTAPKEKKLTGRQYFESGRHTVKGSNTVTDEDEEEEDIDSALSSDSQPWSSKDLEKKQKEAAMAEGNNSGDLMSSGKVVAGAAVSVFQQKSVDNVDKKEVAGAAAEILHAASTYGKFEDKPAGQYIEKTEGYLKEFSSGPAAGAEKEMADAPKSEEPPKEPAPAPAAVESKSEGFGIGDVVKGAESLMEKQGGGEESAAGSAGGLFKMAQGFMK